MREADSLARMTSCYICMQPCLPRAATWDWSRWLTARDYLRLSRFMVCCASHNKEAPPMAHLQCTDMQDRPTEFLDLTSLTLDEFQQLVPPFETAFQAHMAAWRLDGKPRTARQFSVYKNCPLPTPEDRLLFWF